MLRNLHALLTGAFLFIFSFLLANGNPKDVIRLGSKLIYDVNFEGASYEVTVIVKNNNENYTFEWFMSKPANGKGTIQLSKAAIENASGILSHFTNGDISLDDQCCIFLSKKMFEELKNDGSMEIVTDKKKNVKTIFGNPYQHTQSYGYKNNYTNEFQCRTVSDGGDYQITYVDDADFPLIVELNLDWSLKLKNIED